MAAMPLGAAGFEASVAMVIVAALPCACRAPQNTQPAQPAVEQNAQTQNNAAAREIEAQAARFAPVTLTADITTLPENEKQALKRLVQASQIIDTLFLRQVWAGNETMLLDLGRDQSALGTARLHYFILNKGPWSRLDENKAFIPGAPAKPDQANFYPAGATKAEVEAWLATLSERSATFATGFFTTIRRNPDGTLTAGAVPAFEYQGEIARDCAPGQGSGIADHAADAQRRSLEKRAAGVRHRTITTTATSRGWSSTRRSSRPSVRTRSTRTSGSTRRRRSRRSSPSATTRRRTSWPASDRSCRRSRTTSRSTRGSATPSWARWRRFASSTPCFRRGCQSGRADGSLQPSQIRRAAVVKREAGSKRVMMKNNQEAKFHIRSWSRLRRWRWLRQDQSAIAFDAFFTHVLMHELMHGLGPHNINVGGRASTVRQEFKEL